LQITFIAQAGDRPSLLKFLDPQGNVWEKSFSKTSDSGASVTYSKGTDFYYENVLWMYVMFMTKASSEFQKRELYVNVY